MKTLITLTLCLLTSFVHADFISAQKDYQSENYQAAFKEFLTLAKLGNTKSQYNLAVMLVKGQGVEINLAEAYAWAKVAEDNRPNKKLTQKKEKNLTDTQLNQAQQLYTEYFGKHSLSNSRVILGPIVENDPLNTNNSDSTLSDRAEIVIEKQIAPNYPRAMAMKHIQGWVDLSFRIHPDGSVRDINIYDEVPFNGFAKEAIKSVEKYRFSFQKDGKKVPLEHTQYATQRINFKLKGYGSGINDKQQEYLEDLIEKANNGDINAQYTYSYLYDTLLHKKGKIDGKKINQWLFNAAIDGITGAQYRLGQNIFYGNSCKEEKQKGLDWIMQAAQIGNANAQYMAYNMLKNKDIVNQTDSSPLFWLTQAASNGLNIAQLLYSKEVAMLESPTTEQIKTAREYLKNYSNNIYRTTQWYQVNAMLLNKTDEHSKAIKSVKKALKSAKKLGWDLAELEQLKTSILNNKS